MEDERGHFHVKMANRKRHERCSSCSRWKQITKNGCLVYFNRIDFFGRSEELDGCTCKTLKLGVSAYEKMNGSSLAKEMSYGRRTVTWRDGERCKACAK